MASEGPSIHSDTVGIDWLSIVGEEGSLHERIAYLDRKLGARRRKIPGRHHFAQGLAWECGVELFSGHRSCGWMLNVSGKVCAALGGGLLHEIGRHFMLGARCTRIDLYRDQKGERIDTIERAYASCKAGELVRVRGFSPCFEGDAATGDQKLTGLYLGSRKSERFVRVYDKATESKTGPVGSWVRYEAEFRKEHANEVAREVFVGADPEGWCPVAFRLLLGVVEFRVSTGDPNLDRRPLVSWWQGFKAGEESVRLKVEREATQLDGKLAYLATVAKSIAEAAELAGTTPGDILNLVGGEAPEPSAASKRGVLSWQLAAHVVGLLEERASARWESSAAEAMG